MLLEQKTSKLKTPDIATKIGTYPCHVSEQKHPPGGGLIESFVAHLFSLTLLLMPSENLG